MLVYEIYNKKLEKSYIFMEEENVNVPDFFRRPNRYNFPKKLVNDIKNQKAEDFDVVRITRDSKYKKTVQIALEYYICCFWTFLEYNEDFFKDCKSKFWQKNNRKNGLMENYLKNNGYKKMKEKYNTTKCMMVNINLGNFFKTKPKYIYPLRKIKPRIFKRAGKSFQELCELLRISKIDNEFLCHYYSISPKYLKEIINGEVFYEEMKDKYNFPLRHKDGETLLESEVYYDLKFTDMPIAKIARKYGVRNSTIANINYGKTNAKFLKRAYHNITFPIREESVDKKLSDETVEEICLLLRRSNETMVNIGRYYGVRADVVSRINTGKTYTHITEKYIFAFNDHKIRDTFRNKKKKVPKEVVDLILKLRRNLLK